MNFKMEFKPKLISFYYILILFSVSKCSPTDQGDGHGDSDGSFKEGNVRSLDENVSDKTVTSGTILVLNDTKISKPLKSNLTADQTTVQTTIQSNTSTEEQQRFARQTEKPNADGKVYTKEEPEPSDQSIHEIRIKPEDNSRPNKSDAKDLDTSDDNNRRISSEDNSTQANDAITSAD